MGQALTAVKMDVAALLHDVDAPGGAAEKLEARVDAISGVVQSALETASKLCQELRPPVLDSLGLVPALEWAARDFEARSGIFCNVDLPAETSVVDSERATVVFRIFQEMLTNILRHAEATEVSIRFCVEKDVLRLAVTDNGRGFTLTNRGIKPGLGMIGMRERALSVGGVLELSRPERGGAAVTLEIPI
jgi:two-component system sensor kinase